MKTSANQIISLKPDRTPWRWIAVAAAFGVGCWWSPFAQTASAAGDTPAITSAYTDPRTAAFACAGMTAGATENEPGRSGVQTQVAEGKSAAPRVSGSSSPGADTSVYAEFDAQLTPTSALPAWAAERNLHADVSAADPSASITRIACAADFCRVDIARSGPDSPADFVNKLSNQFTDRSAALFKYPDGNANETVMYFMNTTTSSKDGGALVE
jgi:hypothetical protein